MGKILANDKNEGHHQISVANGRAILVFSAIRERSPHCSKLRSVQPSFFSHGEGFSDNVGSFFNKNTMVSVRITWYPTCVKVSKCQKLKMNLEKYSRCKNKCM